jgi:hypothetical protein
VLMRLDRRTSMSQSFIEHNVLHSDIIIRKAMYRFMERIIVSDNVLISTIVNSSYYLNSSLFQCWSKHLFLVNG